MCTKIYKINLSRTYYIRVDMRIDGRNKFNESVIAKCS